MAPFGRQLAVALCERSTISQRSASDGLSISVTNVNNETLLLIFVACTGAAVLMQALVLLAMLITARKALKLAQEQIEELRRRVDAGEPRAEIAREFGISRQSLYRLFREAEHRPES